MELGAVSNNSPDSLSSNLLSLISILYFSKQRNTLQCMYVIYSLISSFLCLQLWVSTLFSYFSHAVCNFSADFRKKSGEVCNKVILHIAYFQI